MNPFCGASSGRRRDKTFCQTVELSQVQEKRGAVKSATRCENQPPFIEQSAYFEKILSLFVLVQLFPGEPGCTNAAHQGNPGPIGLFEFQEIDTLRLQGEEPESALDEVRKEERNIAIRMPAQCNPG